MLPQSVGLSEDCKKHRVQPSENRVGFFRIVCSRFSLIDLISETNSWYFSFLIKNESLFGKCSKTLWYMAITKFRCNFCAPKKCVNFFKLSAISIYCVTLSGAQCVPLEKVSEQANMPLIITTTTTTITAAPPPEIISYEYTKNDIGYMYRWVYEVNYRQFGSNFRFNSHINDWVKV